MAEAVVSFLLDSAFEAIIHGVNLLRGGEEVVRWIEYELETLIPQLERASAHPEQHDSLAVMIREAEDLADTYTKRLIQYKVAKFKNPINSMSIPFLARMLHKKKKEIERATALREQAPLAPAEPPALIIYSIRRMLNKKKIQRARASREQESLSPAEPRAPPDARSVPFYLRQCMHFLLLFPPGFVVPGRRLIVLWVAEGFVHSKKYDTQSVEQIAEGYLHELVHLEVLSVHKRNRSGKAKTYKIDGLRQSALVEEANNANFLRDRKNKIRRLVDHNDNGLSDHSSFIKIDGDPKVFDSVPSYRDVISFLSFNTQEGSKPGDDLGEFLRKCISAGCFLWLRSLDLEEVFRPKLPDRLGKLISLRYLGLRWTYLEQLPDAVDSLLNLQVLDVKHTYISILPRSIWSMEYLRHLYLSEAFRTRFPDPPSRVTLTALQTLWGAFVDEDTCVVDGLDSSLNIRKLGLSCRSRTAEMVNQLQAIDKWISNLEFLESLRLISQDGSGQAADLHLTSLEGNKFLSTVYLLGKLDRLILCELPASLTDITLSGSALNLDPMAFLGRLPNLLILRLLAQSVTYKSMSCTRRGFRRLEILWIWKLDNLNEFTATEDSLPSLKELEIRSCANLVMLPERLRHLENLEIKLTSMPQEFVHRASTKYTKVQFVANDDQYILTNTSTRFELETEDLVSPCFVGSQNSISGSSNSGSIF